MTAGKLRWPKRALISFLLLCAVGCAGWYYRKTLPDVAANYQTMVVSRGDLLQVVTASGQLDPVVKVEVGSQISGNIQKLNVDFNSPVKQGQVIAQLDPASYEATFIQAEGNLANARANSGPSHLAVCSVVDFWASVVNRRHRASSPSPETRRSERSMLALPF